MTRPGGTVLAGVGLLNIGAASRACAAPAPTLARGAPRAMVQSAGSVAGDRALVGAPYAIGRGTIEHRGSGPGPARIARSACRRRHARGQVPLEGHNA